MSGFTNDLWPGIGTLGSGLDRFPRFRPCSGETMGGVAKLSRPLPGRTARAEDDESSEVRLKWAVAQHSRFVWRTLVRFGVRQADAEDAAQEVFLVLARRLPEVSVSSEKG